MQNKAQIYAKVLVEALDGVSEDEVLKRIGKFKGILYKHGQSKQSSAIIQEFIKAWEERNGQIAEVVSARPLSENLKKQIKEKLSKGNYVMKEKIDEKVIGGTALFLGNQYLIDGTVKGKLRKMESIIRNKLSV